MWGSITAHAGGDGLAVKVLAGDVRAGGVVQVGSGMRRHRADWRWRRWQLAGPFSLW